MDGPVRVSLVRTGGFAGLRTATEVDTSVLSEADAAEVNELVDLLVAALEAPAAGPPGARGADRFSYELTIDSGGRSRRLSVSEADLDPQTRGLLARLEARARG